MKYQNNSLILSSWEGILEIGFLLLFTSPLIVQQETKQNKENKMKGLFGFALVMWFVAVLLSLSVFGGICCLLYTIITKPEVLAHWIKVVSGG